MKFLALCLFISVALCAELPRRVPLGICHISGLPLDPGVSGTIFFEGTRTGVLVTANIAGITQNLGQLHGMHIHQYGDLEDANGTLLGPHYHSVGGVHGCAPGVHSIGDLGNWMVDLYGNINMRREFEGVSLTGMSSIIGRGLSLVAETDTCLPGDTNFTQIANCIIGIANPESFMLPNTTINSAVQLASAPFAVCIMEPFSELSANITGIIYLNQAGDYTLIRANILGLPPRSSHGWHIHDFGDINAGGVYNPLNAPHGNPPSVRRELGALGNLFSDENGEAVYQDFNTLVSLSGPYSVVGRSIEIHQFPDDGISIETVGDPIARCTIGLGFPMI